MASRLVDFELEVGVQRKIKLTILGAQNVEERLGKGLGQVIMEASLRGMATILFEACKYSDQELSRPQFDKLLQQFFERDEEALIHIGKKVGEVVDASGLFGKKEKPEGEEAGKQAAGGSSSTLAPSASENGLKASREMPMPGDLPRQNSAG